MQHPISLLTILLDALPESLCRLFMQFAQVGVLQLKGILADLQVEGDGYCVVGHIFRFQ